MTSGIWTISFKTPLGKNEFDLVATVDGGKLTGVINGKINKGTAISNGKVDGCMVSFQAPLITPLGEMGTSFQFESKDDALIGTMSTRLGAFKATGKKREDT